ncbi:MAG: hypothetical protein Kow0092_35650 [Deferrisomatales bacterium]
MEPTILPQVLAALLLAASSIALVSGRPVVPDWTAFFDKVLRRWMPRAGFRLRRRAPCRRVVMRGARPWWE